MEQHDAKLHEDVGYIRAKVEKISCIEKKIDDLLCESVADCQMVADYEKWIVQMQRKRVNVSRIAHLQDEIADTLQMIHPFSGMAKSILVTDLTRTMHIPPPGSDNGALEDDIQGWVIN